MARHVIALMVWSADLVCRVAGAAASGEVARRKVQPSETRKRK